MKFDKKFQLTFILITMFLNTVGFTIIIPIIPFLLEKYIPASQLAWYIGLFLSSYSLCQFLAAPGLGALSDRFGRKPILLISLLGSVIGYLFLGLGGALWILFLGRIIDGLTGGNISTIYSYIADITPPEKRGKIFGTLGAAGGLGFMIGPAIGGFTAHISLSTPLFLAAGITFLNLIFGIFVLPESLPKEHKIEKIDVKHLNPFTQFGHVFSIPALKRIFISAFGFFLAMNASYAIYGIFLKDIFSWNPSKIGLFLFFVGILDIITQGFLVQKLLHRITESKVTIIGLVLVTVGFALGAATAAIPSLILFGVAVIVINIGDGLYEPSVASLISGSVDHKMQGRVQGASQGMQSVARIIGPILAASVYIYWRGLPFAVESFLVLIALIVISFF